MNEQDKRIKNLTKLNKELSRRLDKVQKFGMTLVEYEKVRYGNPRISTVDVTAIGEDLIRLSFGNDKH